MLLAIDGLGIGGAEMVVRDLALRLDPGRFAVAVCCTKSLGTTADRLLRDGADVFVLPKRTDGRVDYLTPLKLRRAVIERGGDHRKVFELFRPGLDLKAEASSFTRGDGVLVRGV